MRPVPCCCGKKTKLQASSSRETASSKHQDPSFPFIWCSKFGGSLDLGGWGWELLHRHDLFFFVPQMLIDLGDVLVCELLEFFLGVFHFILGRAAIMAVFLQLLHGIAADVADGHPPVLGHFLDDFDEFLAPLLA